MVKVKKRSKEMGMENKVEFNDYENKLFGVTEDKVAFQCTSVIAA